MNLTYVSANLLHASRRTNIRAVASYRGISGRLHRFTINAFDESGLVGTAEHTRAVVFERRPLNVVRDRAVTPELQLTV